MRAWIRVACGLAALAAWQVAAADGPAQAASLADALAVIQAHRFVDDKDGFRINEYCHIGQWGTHVEGFPARVIAVVP